MNKEILADLFGRKDKKRRRILYMVYADLISSPMSAAYIAEMICKDLGLEKLVTASDIKFCRHHFKDKVVISGGLIKHTVKTRDTFALSEHKQKLVEPIKAEPFNGTWSDADQINTQDNIIVKSKFAKKS